MAFRERSAWWMAGLWAAVLAWYLAEMQPWAWTVETMPRPLGPVTWVTGLIITGSIVIQTVLAARTPDEAEAPADERERAIIDRAGRWSGELMGLLAIAGLLHYLKHGTGDFLFHSLFLAILIACLVEQVALVFLFRRGL